MSICYEGIAIPIYWKLLKKAGSSNSKEQITLISMFINTFGKERIEALLADREFPNENLFSWLNKQEIPFFIRVKSDSLVYIKGKRYKKTGDLFSTVNPNEESVLNMAVTLHKTRIFLAASRNEKGELLIVATNKTPKIAIAAYLRRWEIETLFQAFKGRGFRLEDTRVTCLERLSKIMSFLAVGFAWAHKTGEWKAKKKPIPFKKIGNQIRPKFSFFRYGFDLLRSLFTSPTTFRRKNKGILDLITPLNSQVKLIS